MLQTMKDVKNAARIAENVKDPLKMARMRRECYRHQKL